MYVKCTRGDAPEKNISDGTGNFIEGYGKYQAGLALENGTWYSQPVCPGGPSSFQIAQVAGTIAASAVGGPAAAFAFNCIMTGVQVADGTLSMKQAMVQVGVSAATSFAGGAVGGGILGTVTTQSLSMAASGINYEEDGGIGWSKSNFKAGVKRGLVNMAVQGAIQGSGLGASMQDSRGLTAGVTGLTTFTNSMLDFDTKGFGIGVKKGKDNFEHGLSSSAASAAARAVTYRDPNKEDLAGKAKTDFTGVFSLGDYTSKLVYNAINSGLMSAYTMKKEGASWADASATNGFWSGMTYTTSDLGGYMGSKAWDATAGYLHEQEQKEERRIQRQNAELGLDSMPDEPAMPNDPYAEAERNLVGSGRRNELSQEEIKDLIAQGRERYMST